jgi:hypothetical protein
MTGGGGEMAAAPGTTESKNVKIISLAPLFTEVIMEKRRIFEILK